MSITLGEIITSLLSWVGVISTIALGVALGVYIIRRVFSCSVENTYIFEDNSCFCEDTGCCDSEQKCEGCPMSCGAKQVDESFFSDCKEEKKVK